MHITVLMLQCLDKFFSLSLVFCLFITTEQRKILEKRKVLMHNFFSSFKRCKCCFKLISAGVSGKNALPIYNFSFNNSVCIKLG